MELKPFFDQLSDRGVRFFISFVRHPLEENILRGVYIRPYGLIRDIFGLYTVDFERWESKECTILSVDLAVNHGQTTLLTLKKEEIDKIDSESFENLLTHYTIGLLFLSPPP